MSMRLSIIVFVGKQFAETMRSAKYDVFLCVSGSCELGQLDGDQDFNVRHRGARVCAHSLLRASGTCRSLTPGIKWKPG